MFIKYPLIIKYIYYLMNSVHQRAFSNSSQHGCHTIFRHFLCTKFMYYYLFTMFADAPNNRNCSVPGCCFVFSLLERVRNRWAVALSFFVGIGAE